MKQFLVVLSFISLQLATEAAEPKRVALVVGNSRYSSGPLKNPSNDADAVSAMLRSLGFQVTKKKDVTRQQFEDGVDAVTANLGSGDMCLIFFAGHGMQMEQENYLVPVGVTLERPQHVETRCVRVSYLLSALRHSKCSLKVIVVDACRNNPFRSITRSNTGLAALEAPEGTIVSFSTSPQSTALDGTGDNSPFAKHFVSVFKAQADKSHIVDLFLKTSRAVRKETGQRGYLDMDSSMPEFYLQPRRDTNSIGMEFALIPSGTFQMGSRDSEEGARDSQKPEHEVTITRAFKMQTTEVTQGQWFAVMRTKPWQGQDYVKEGNEFPANFVSWDDAVEFCRKLSKQEGVIYRLPTEAEWEYAARCGQPFDYSTPLYKIDLRDHVWFHANAWEAGEKYAHKVATKRPNLWGLYDMQGNLSEWCSDWYGSDYYATSERNDPKGPASGSERVLRGGSWYTMWYNAQKKTRASKESGFRAVIYGFRVVQVQGQ